MAHRFYTNSELAPGEFLLQGPEFHHLANVSRFRPGDLVVLFNGDGHEYPARVDSLDRRTASLTVLSCDSPEREHSFRVDVAVALPKGDRADFLVEKLTELGAAALIPLRTERTVVQPREGKLDRLQRSVIEASKQCGRNVLMVIESVVDWPDFLHRDSPCKHRYVAHPGGVSLPLDAMQHDVCLAIGPEGGFTDDEIHQAVALGWQIVGLGPRVLRVETAAIMLASRVI